MRKSAIALFLLAAAPTIALADPPAAAPAQPDAKPAEARPFPLPAPEGKPIPVAANQRVFRVPMRFAKVEKFYRDQLGADRRITFTADRREEPRTLTVVSRRDTDTWSKAVIREGVVDTTIEVTPIVRFATPEVIDGRMKPLVQFVMPRNPAAVEAANSIDHMQQGPR